ncbi:flagellar hook-associated protein FlgL [Aliarcobacter butzleri]|uniref:Flagellar hook-associated protein FlgL n=1 Tax=Aliarcobacter butzleri TaxID=28197 RepID=A0AAW7QCN9_9BACT|nr:flagellar hook-associated protein FlgL [Aliarcobacter butzleri]MCP3650370.1 flagellar hook-associated protein FlgL [Arcobacter sp. DNRA7]MCR1816543.1 flagellar hook-associated protein FlgL [Aliarcobacter butzleri]MDN5107664.1 flagellar hook-associated protein FlgL [Aliarcobacter butzleri]MDN5124134.1 flagellar hook-associated protein FlgL [Aliarcobacter butzleri]
MIAQVNSSLYRLNNLNSTQDKLNYQMGGDKLEYGSDDSMLFGRLSHINDKVLTQTEIKDQLEKTKALNSTADDSLAEAKENVFEFVKSELIKANTDTTSEEGLLAIAQNIEGVKQNLLDLANTQVEGQYLFSGSDSSVKAFTMDANGKVTYNGNDSLRKIAVDEGSYRESGVNGFQAFFYTTDSALKGETLTFEADSKILDQDGNEWTLDTATNTLSKKNWDGSFDTLTVTPPTAPATEYSVTVPNTDGARFEAKKNVFDLLDEAINSLRGVDSVGNPLTAEDKKTKISAAQDGIDKVIDNIAVAHADLGARNKTFNNSLDIIESKISQYNKTSTEIGSSNLTEVGIKLKSLELMFSALYSTISQTNQLSLVNYMK